MVTPAAGNGPLRASHADRERVVDALKAAFVQGRLTQDELDARVGQALAARTYADLAALTRDLPAEPDRTPTQAPAPAQSPPAPAPVPAAPAARQSRNRAANSAVKVGAYTIGGIILVISGAVAGAGQPIAAVVLAVFMVMLTAVPTALVAALVTLALKAESRHGNRSRRQLPPGPASGSPGQACPPVAHPNRKLRGRPPGSLAVASAS